MPLANRQPAASLLTPGGRAAVATIAVDHGLERLDGATPPLFHAANGRRLVDQPVGRIVFGRWGKSVLEEVLLCKVDSQTVEIHCHGGAAAAKAILSDLKLLGIAVLPWAEFLIRAHDALFCETVTALAHAPTERAASLLLEQHSGLLRSRLESTASLLAPTGRPEQALEQLRDLLEWSRFGLRLSEPWNVVLAGRPNVGKSSLINALVGYGRSIVSSEPGTTRDVVCVETALEGWPVRLADTAGMRNEAEHIETLGIERARKSAAEADCLLMLVDVGQPPHAEDEHLLASHPEALLVAHKCDLPDAWGDRLPRRALPVSSLTGAGLEDLSRAIVARLVPRLPSPGTAIPVSLRQVALLTQAHDALARCDINVCSAAIDACLGRSHP